MAECPVCGYEIEFKEDTIEGELIGCPECGTELEVLSIDPELLDLSPELEEDWGQ